MRFSLKWALAVTAYVALAATAFATRNDLFAVAVWGVSVLAICYAVVVACLGRDKRRYMALGFVAVSAANIVCICLAPDRVPSSRALELAGYQVMSNGDVISVRQPMTMHAYFSAPYKAFAGTAHAVSALAAGLVGAGLGALAYRRGQAGE